MYNGNKNLGFLINVSIIYVKEIFSFFVLFNLGRNSEG